MKWALHDLHARDRVKYKAFFFFTPKFFYKFSSETNGLVITC